MCGRYTLFSELQTWSEAAIDWPIEEGFDWSPSYNIAPSMRAPVVPNLDRPAVSLYRWGLVPQWAKDQAIGQRMINARAESLAEKPAFRDAAKRRRCLVLANGFYEWQPKTAGKTPYYIALKSSRVFAFAGLWERWKTPEGEWLKSFTIITTEANALIAPIHNRMPVILTPDAYRRWLDPTPQEANLLGDLLTPYPADELLAYPVSKMVNSPANNTPECIRPLLP
jgi:putative SOS response-associated peptidase YedK